VVGGQYEQTQIEVGEEFRLGQAQHDDGAGDTMQRVVATAHEETHERTVCGAGKRQVFG